jgi:hypothetical protein
VVELVGVHLDALFFFGVVVEGGCVAKSLEEFLFAVVMLVSICM